MRGRAIGLTVCLAAIAAVAWSGCARNRGDGARLTPPISRKPIAELAREVDINQPAIAIYTESPGMRILSPGAPPEENPKLVLAVWTNGWMVWSTHPIEGGKLYLTGQTDPAHIERLVGELDRKGAFKDEAISKAFCVGPDAGSTVIEIRYKDRRMNMRSWHELYEQNPGTVALSTGLTGVEGSREKMLAAEPQWYRRFRAVWSMIRKTTTGWIPTDAQPYSGKRPILPLGQQGATAGDALLGKWLSQADHETTWEFTTDGRMIVTVGGSAQTGTYWVVGERVMMLAPPPSDMGTTERFNITGDRLTLTNGSESHFKRMK